jgi:branched-chain amino acid transport system ATP-binding protein
VTGEALEIRGLEAGYGTSQVLFGIDLDIAQGEFVTLIGRNGMGKSTIVKSILGILTPQNGRIVYGGRDITGLQPYVAARTGIGLVPEGRQVFSNLSVWENLVATARSGPARVASEWTIDSVYALFPRLKERQRNLAATLSGGEQQMLAIGRALLTNPSLLILDEATEGLAPIVRTDIWKCLKTLKSSGLSLLVIDKNIAPLLKLADRHYVMEKGKIVWSGSSGGFEHDFGMLQKRLGV